ncbi:cbb3-type cytochrome c oxidase N-terminal domain-containing protein [Hymenobacter caeli]|uniref:Cytochrome c oxidase cbb3-type subunit 3 n=1 Tax=Hymenobacter caeli TaxID=2735894 RepID=A0ABX2FSN2_9BACT|nr:cbb3-type cytochrome c oxidase N-terminal domain-containing protein [Hymenobacter caeli]NRT20198.1 cytochrome c oxidase cbb3-type subunit 3 [Hymenobacter caeli]
MIRPRQALLAAGAVLLATRAALAQTAATSTPAAADSNYALVWFLLSTLVLVGMVFLVLFVALISWMRPQLRQLYNLPTVHDTWSGQVLGLLVGDARLVQGEVRDELLDHDYDGIHEFDNDLPPWWKWGFAFTVVFAISYVTYYHVMRKGLLQGAEYAAEMQQAALFVPVGGDDPNQVTTYAALTAPADLSSGKSIFATNCAPCHGANAEGKVGPNLTDEFWLHGGNVNNLYKTIKFGINGKGMVAWKGKLSGKQMLQVASYALSLQGSKPANPKAPQGEKEAASKPVAKL